MLENYTACWVDPEQEERLKSIDPAKGEKEKKGAKSQTVTALNSIDIHFETGKLYILLGSVGSGKT